MRFPCCFLEYKQRKNSSFPAIQKLRSLIDEDKLQASAAIS